MKHLTILLVLQLFYPACTTTAKETTAPAEPAQQGQVEGAVVIVGTMPNARAVIEPNGPKSQVELCPSSEATDVRLFGGVIINAQGKFESHPQTKERCFAVQSFRVLQLIKGKSAVVGVLAEPETGTFQVTDEEGKVFLLEGASKGVKALKGKKVIFDFVPSTQGATTKDGKERFKVVTYKEYPSR